jgi:hypothetical protein
MGLVVVRQGGEAAVGGRRAGLKRGAVKVNLRRGGGGG